MVCLSLTLASTVTSILVALAAIKCFALSLVEHHVSINNARFKTTLRITYRARTRLVKVPVVNSV